MLSARTRFASDSGPSSSARGQPRDRSMSARLRVLCGESKKKLRAPNMIWAKSNASVPAVCAKRESDRGAGRWRQKRADKTGPKEATRPRTRGEAKGRNAARHVVRVAKKESEPLHVVVLSMRRCGARGGRGRGRGGAGPCPCRRCALAAGGGADEAGGRGVLFAADGIRLSCGGGGSERVQSVGGRRRVRGWVR